MSLPQPVILRLGEESKRATASGHCAGFFAKPANEHPLFVILRAAEESSSATAFSDRAGFFAKPQNDKLRKSSSAEHHSTARRCLGSQNDKQGVFGWNEDLDDPAANA
jgi:hypothetical protein